MQLNNTTQYAIRILRFIAKEENDRLHSAKELSSSLQIPYKFLTKIMTELTKAKFILSLRGREGGYKLSKPASEITILEILNYFNELSNYKECILGIGECDAKKKCFLHDKWLEPKKSIQKMFAETTLENMQEDDFKI